MINYSRLISRTIIEDDYISPDLKFPIQYVFSHFIPNNISHVNYPVDKEISKIEIKNPSCVKDELVMNEASFKSLLNYSTVDLTTKVYEDYQKHIAEKIFASLSVLKEVVLEDIGHSDTFSISLGVPNSNKDIMPGSNPPLSEEEYIKYLDDVLSS